jgi:hypothetical protein
MTTSGSDKKLTGGENGRSPVGALHVAVVPGGCDVTSQHPVHTLDLIDDPRRRLAEDTDRKP